jgi:hypothetical protein
VIDGAPEIHLLTANPDHHLVQMPPVTRPRATPAQPSGNRRAEFQHPTPHRYSFLARLSDGEFQQGMAALRNAGNAISQTDAVTEEIDWFVLRRG